MPYYNDVPYYYGASYANHSSLMTGTGRFVAGRAMRKVSAKNTSGNNNNKTSPFTPLSRFSPHLSTISESPFNHLHRFSPISVRHPRRVIDTADIDVSSPRILSHELGNRPRNRLRRDRPTIKIRSHALKDNPALRVHQERHEKSVGELLMEKFFIKEKKSPSGDGGQQQPIRLYHQVSLDSDEGAEDRDGLRKRVTRRFTRRRSSADLQLDPEQLQREATYAQVQAKVLDSLVAEEQAQIESEARRGTLIRKGTVRGGPVNGHSNYYSNSAESDTMTREEEEEAALRSARKIAKKTKRKKKPADKPSPPDRLANDHAAAADNRRSSTSSELSTDSKVEDDVLEENGPRMYKIEACNSAGDFSTIWVDEAQRKRSVEQFRESVRVPIPRKLGSSGADAAKSAVETETRVVLPVKKSYVMDPSRNSVYLTMKKPLEKVRDEKLDEKISGGLEVDGVQRLANGFADAAANREGDVLKSATCDDESLKLNGEMRPSDHVKDGAFNKPAAKLKRSEEFPTKKKDLRATPKSLDNDDARVKRDTVISKTKDEEGREAEGESLKSTKTTDTSSASVGSGVSTSAQAEQTSSKDVLGMKTKKDVEDGKNEIDAAKQSLETVATIKTKTSEAVALSKNESLDVNMKESNENRKDEIGAAKKNLEATATVKTLEAVASPKEILSATTKKNENQNSENAIDTAKKNLEATATVKTSETVASSKETLPMIMKKDNRKNESTIGVTKNLEAVTLTKTSETLASSKDALSATTKRDNENLKDENIIGVAKKNLESVTTTKASKALASSKDVLSATTKKDNENLKDENTIGVTKKNLESVTMTKALKALASSKDALSATTKRDNENLKDENTIGVAKKNLESVTTTKTSEILASSKDALSATTKRDNENLKDENTIGVAKKNLESVTTTKASKALASSKDALSATTKRDNENLKDENTIGVAKKNLESVTPTKTSKALASSKDALSATTKRDNENLKDENTIGVAKKNLESVTPTKTSETLASSKDALSVTTKKDNENRKNENASTMTKKNLESATKSKISEAASRTGRLAREEAQDASDTPKILAMLHEEDATTTRRSVVTNAGDETRENSASIAMTMSTASATGLPKASKINADRNNAVEAPELSLREAAAYLANGSLANKSESRVAAAAEVNVDALPGKKADKVTNLAKKRSALDAPSKKANGVDREAAELADDDAAKSKSDGSTLPEGANDEVRSNERNEIGAKTGDVRSTRDNTGLTKTPKYKARTASRELPSETTPSSPASTKSAAEVTVAGSPSDAPQEARPLRIDAKKVSAADVGRESSRDSGVSSPKGKVSKVSGESKFPFKVKTLQQIAANEDSPKATKNDDGKAPTRKDANAPRLLKKSTSVDSPKGDLSPSNVPGNKTLQRSVDEKVDKSMPVKKPLEPTRFPAKVIAKKPAVGCVDRLEKPPADSSGQLSKSASTESIDFWSEIKAPDSPRATRSNKSAAISPGDAKSTGGKTDPISGPNRASGESRAKPSPIKEPEEKKNESDVKISVAAAAAPAVDDVVAEARPKEGAAVIQPEAPKTTEKSAQQQTKKAPRAKKKNSNLSIAIGAKEPIVKKASRPDSDATPAPADTPSSETPTPLVEIAVPAINIVEAPKLAQGAGDHENYEDATTPTNELPDPGLSSKISKWSNRDDLTNTDDTPVVSEEASLAASPAASPQSSKTKRATPQKKKKPSGKKPSTKADKESPKKAAESTPTSQQNTLVVKQPDKQLLGKPSPRASPRSSPRNSPSQRPLDLIKMFYTTPSALLTATPRDLSKVRRAKIKRRRYHSRTPSVSSDSTGSTTSSTATTESTDGSGSTCTELDDDAEHKRMNSTRSNDSGFDGSPRISSTYLLLQAVAWLSGSIVLATPDGFRTIPSSLA